MPERDQNLPVHLRHLTARKLAKYFHEDADTVGKKYETYASLWKSPEANIQTGLLHLILDQLKAISDKLGPKEDPLDKHRRWLVARPRIVELSKLHDEQLDRLEAMFGVKLASDDAYKHTLVTAKKGFNWWGAEWLEGKRQDLESKVARLESVKNPEDVTNLKGVGKVTAAKLLANLPGNENQTVS